ncbi:MAG: HAD hydrolase family protein [Deltaproteobacteria bacterium]|nr:HAD hydrolase family protein [Deltaproteobacteria bacterium]
MNPEKLKKIKLLLLDVDGVLTDGGIIYTDSGEQVKVFNSRDGLGIRLLKDAGIEVGIVTGRTSGVLRHRCENLKIDLLFDGVVDKASVFKQIRAKTGVDPLEMAFAGDDLVDLPLLRLVGVSIAVADAHESVIPRVDWVTQAPGGHGAVREICDAILKARGLYDEIIEKWAAGGRKR